MREMREKCIFEKLKCKTKESSLHPDIASSEKCFEFIPLSAEERIQKRKVFS